MKWNTALFHLRLCRRLLCFKIHNKNLESIWTIYWLETEFWQVGNQNGSNIPNITANNSATIADSRRSSNALSRFEHRRHTSVAMNRNYSETSMISIPADKNNKAIILDVGGKKHNIRGNPNKYSPIQLLTIFQWTTSTSIPIRVLGSLSRLKSWKKFSTSAMTSVPGSRPSIFSTGKLLQCWQK